jgi:hypothetical protein
MKSLPLALTLSLLATVLAASELISSKDEASLNSSMPMQQSYELRCRGGALKFSSSPGSTSSSGEQMMNMTVNFAAGTQGAGARTPILTPGQCSWVDRGFRPGEPTEIRLEMVYFAQQQQALHGSPVDRTPTAAERYPDAQNVPQYLSSSDHYWSFWVYNTSNGYLQSTTHRYFKPLKTLPGDKVRIPPPVRPGNVNESF